MPFEKNIISLQNHSGWKQCINCVDCEQHLHSEISLKISAKFYQRWPAISGSLRYFENPNKNKSL